VKNRIVFLTAALAAAVPLSGVDAQPATSDTQKIAGVVVLDGVYEIVGGGSGVLGYVLTRTGNKANFQPCTGQVRLVDESDLKRTNLNCEDEPSPDHPFNVSCADIETQVAILASTTGENIKDVPIGTVFLKAANGYTKVVPPTPDEDWLQWNAASTAPVAVCDQKYIFLPKVQADQAWIGVIKNASQ
jgi:hypothetical protein